MKNPTLRKCRNRGLTAIRYKDGDCNRHGWIVEQLPKGKLRVQLIGDEHVRRLSADEARWVKVLDAAAS